MILSSDVQDLERRDFDRGLGAFGHIGVSFAEFVKAGIHGHRLVTCDPELPIPGLRVGPDVLVAGRPVWQPSLDFGGNGELVFGGQVDSVYAGSLGIWTADVYQAATHEGDTVVDTVVLQLQLDLVESAGRAMVPVYVCLLYTSPSPRDVEESRMPSSA